MRKKLLKILTVVMLAMFMAFTLTACIDFGGSENDGATSNSEILAIYNTYVAYEEENGISPMSLIGQAENPVFDKYDEYIPNSLLQKAYAADKLDPYEAEQRIIEILKEYSE